MANNGEGEEEDYMGDLSQFLPPELSDTSNSSSKKVGFFILLLFLFSLFFFHFNFIFIPSLFLFKILQIKSLK